MTGELGAAALARARAERRGTRSGGSRCRGSRGAGRWPGSPRVTGCIDVSDGLTADLAHLLGPARRARSTPARSRCRAASRRLPALGLDPRHVALAGGDDYELLFAVGPGGAAAAALSRRLGIRVTELGRVEPGRHRRPDPAFDHFAAGHPEPHLVAGSRWDFRGPEIKKPAPPTDSPRVRVALTHKFVWAR